MPAQGIQGTKMKSNKKMNSMLVKDNHQITAPGLHLPPKPGHQSKDSVDEMPEQLNGDSLIEVPKVIMDDGPTVFPPLKVE